MDWASSAAVVPSASSRCEPSGSRTEMTPAIVHPFLLPAGGSLLVRTPFVVSPRVLDRPSRPAPVPGPSVRAATPEQRRAVGHGPAGGRLVVERRAARPGVSRSSSSAARTRAERRAGAVAVRPSGGAPPQRQPGRRRRHVLARPPVPVARGSGAPAGPGARPPGPTPCRGRPRRPGCRATSTSWCRRGRPARRGTTGARTACPVTASDCAASHSWCGKTRSRPPPWMSIVSPELAQRQGRALDVPARPSRTPARLPGRLVGQRGLPQDEVQRVALVGVVGMAAVLCRQLQHVVPAVAADAPELGEGGHAEVDGAARLVGVAAVERGPDQRQDLGDGRGGPGLGVARAAGSSSPMSASKRAISSAARSR